ncbi:NnrS family protein (plasmid) [Shinella sp. PSBB067]|uniref:NnrS family protein n=1 Tax=unclassified Shinella TaxID=2643062 RepID=UPI00193B3DE4|nr:MULTISPECIES: NnrS family protein [unclassified Shinella]QRI61624.1 NnrS family protein [Shinella sp. PSBB067]
MTASQPAARVSRAVPRGLSRTGPVLFSYGFRPFFLAGGVWAVVAMVLWIATITGRIDLAGDYGAPNWHAHEMLFGFASAVLAGFLLTAVPNWTGRLPVSGWPLAGLFGLWCAGRLALLAADRIGVVEAAVIDGLFLPVLLGICTREIVAGRKWKDLKILGGLLALSLANAVFHVAVIGGGDDHMAIRLGVAAYVVLVMIVGGRIVPSFTRNWLNKVGRSDFPVPYNRFDTAAILAGVAALAAWTAVPAHPATAGLGIVAAVLHAIRLRRWRGWTTLPEKLLVVLHVAYAFVPLGLLAIAFSALGYLEERSVLHVLSVGAIACMMLAVMTRASLGHTGRPLAASRLTVAAYVALVLCALVRPFGEVLPDASEQIYAAAGLLWIVAFGLFCLEYAPILARKRRVPL